MSTKPLPSEAELQVPGDESKAIPVAKGTERHSVSPVTVKHGIQIKSMIDQPLDLTFARYSYSWAPFSDSSLFTAHEQWIELVETTKPGPHICCFRLQNDEQLMDNITHCSGASTLAVIAINDKNNYSINPGAYQGKKCTVPVLILTSEDGMRLQSVLRQNQGGILARIMPKPKSPTVRPSRKSQVTPKRSPFNLKMELKSLLFPMEGIIRIASEDAHIYQQAMDMFQQFERQVHGSLLRSSEREEIAHKALKLLAKELDETLPRDFPFYIGILYRIQQNESAYRCDEFSEFTSDCIKKMEQSDPVAVSGALHSFLYRRGFESVRLLVGRQTLSPYTLLDVACVNVLDITRFKQRVSLMGGKRKHQNSVYPRMLWVTVSMKIRSEIQPLTAESNLWRRHILKEMEQTHLDSSVVEQLKNGLEFGKLVDLPRQLTFNAGLLLPLLAPDKGLNLFTEISDAMKTLEPYISNQSEFTNLLSDIRSSHTTWFISTLKKKEYVKKISKEQSLSFAIRGGLAFLDMIHSIWQKRGWKLHQIHSECQKWLSLLISLVDASATHADMHFKEFLVTSSSVTKIHHNHIKQQIIACVMDKQHWLSLQNFYELYKAFNFWPKDIVKDFIKNFKLSQSVKLSDAIWQDLFTLVVERLPFAQYYELICEFLEEAEACYHKSKRGIEFLQDILKLNVPGLFQPDSTSSKPIVNERLVVLIQGHIRRAGQSSLQHTLPDILLDRCSGEVGYFQQLVLEVVLKELISDSQVLKGSVDCIISKSLNTVVEMLCTDLKSSFSNPTTIQEFCWKFVVRCCLKVAIHEQNFDWISSYSHAITKLGQLHHVYCALSFLSDRECILHEIPKQVQNQVFVMSYFAWVQHIHKFLLSWNDKLSADEGTYDQILLYSYHYLHIYELGKAVAASSVVVPSDALGRMKAQFCSEFEELTMILVPHVADSHKFCYKCLPALLEEYGLHFPAAIQQQVHKMVIFSEDDYSETFPMTNQPKLRELSSLERHGVTMHLTAPTSLKELMTLNSALMQFLKPIKPYITMLVGLCGNEIFRKYLQFQREKQTLTISSAAHGDSELVLFQSSLKQAVALLVNLIEGSDITYKQITAEGRLLLEELNIKREFADICYFLPGRQSEHGLIGIQSMMELFQFAHHIHRIHDVLRQYHLQNCLQDKNMQYLLAIESELKDQRSREDLKPAGAITRLKTVLKALCLKDASDTDFLQLFKEVSDSTEFYAFVQEQFFGTYADHQELEASTHSGTISEAAAHTTFQQLYEIITWQLQHEDYNEQVLNHLKIAFRYILPFINQEQDLHTLMTKVVHLDASSEFKELQTVNDNINLIRLWFSRAEGDTLENVSKELDGILESGCYHFTTRLTSCVEVSLEFEASTVVHLPHHASRARNLPQDATSPKAHVTERWNNWQIFDFVRKLGLVDSQDRVNKQISYFLQLNAMAFKLRDVMGKLLELGHFQQHHFADPLSCDTPLSETEDKLSHAESELSRWQDKVTNLRQSHKWLLFFRVPKVLTLSALLQAHPKPMVNRIAKEISFLFQNSLPVRQMLEMNITRLMKEETNTPNFSDAMSAVGDFLDRLLLLPDVQRSVLPQRFFPLQLPAYPGSILHTGLNYSQSQLLRLIIDILGGVPESFDILHCFPSTTEEDLKLFIKRAESYPRQYVIVEVNHLPYHLQEILLELYLDSRPLASTVHFIETTPSIFREVPWIQTRDHNDLGPSLSFQDAQKICLETARKFAAGKLSNVVLVYGCPGVGKTHYIHSKLKNVKHFQIIAVNEAFTRLNAIHKLNKLPTNDESCAIFFNFSLLPPGGAVHQSESDNYEQLMNEIGWFFFDLLILGYVQDLATGESFHFPFDLGWNIYVEVPSRPPNKESPEVTLKDFREKDVPSLGLVGCEHYISTDAPYCVDDDVQLVCKYLRAHKSGRINTLYGEGTGAVTFPLKQNLTEKEFLKVVKRLRFRKELVDHLWDAYSTGNLHQVLIQESPIRFGAEADVTDSLCHELLDEFMTDEMKKSKMTQKLFISYMARRCKFLDSFPAFNLNSGIGETISDKGRPKGYTNTVILGSTLMDTMLQEVDEICRQNQKGWAQKNHQQLLYDYKSGCGSIGLISLTPEQLPGRNTFERIGIEIPTGNEMHSRAFLDACLSRVLNVPLNRAKRLAPIDESNYVLTLDYALKMLNIHERYKCRVPVIIEGETGVGKTALVEMLSKLWNHAWVALWNRDKNDLLELMQQNIGGLPVDSTLEKCLQILENFSSGEVIKEGNLELIVTQPDAAYLSNKNQQNALDRDSFDSSVGEGVINSYSDRLRLDTSLIFESPSKSQGFWLVLRQRLLKVHGNPILSLLEFPPTKDNVTLESLFLAVGEDENNVKAITKLLYLLLNARVRTIFDKLNVDAALKPTAIRKFFRKVSAQAAELRESFHNCSEKWPHHSGVPFVIVYLDEVNTSSCLGLFKEIIVDGTIEGEALPKNLFILAACNPHRGNSLASRDAPKKQSKQDMLSTKRELKTTYYVRQLHPTLELLKWDYGALNEYQEQEYVTAKMVLLQDQLIKWGIPQLSITDIACLTELIVDSQKKMREYAYQQLVKGGKPLDDVVTESKSTVSQRDIQRVFTFYKWLMHVYSKFHPHQHQPEYHRRAVLVALGLVYYMRLTSQYRKQYSIWLDCPHKNLTGEITFSRAIEEELNWYAERVQLPPGIAKTQALKENLLATIVCSVTRTPLIIEGTPGSSKTLSFNVAVANLKGKESKKATFQETNIFHALDPHFYQCSRQTTSEEIKTIFQRAINRQKSQSKCPTQSYCVVFMDEAGLPETERESLKVLHYYLDEPEVSFVAITNHALDAAKTNRAISLYRPTSSVDDLKKLAKECLQSVGNNNTEVVESFCSAYSSVMAEEKWTSFFGLRDFIYFLIYLRRKHSKAKISPQTVLEALERNFNGTEDFQELCKEFLGMDTAHLHFRNILEVLRDSLKENALSSASELQMGIQSEVRYKLLIDPSEDDSLLRFLFEFGVLDSTSTKLYVCSDFPGDSHSEINTIANIRHSAFKGDTVLLCQTDRIHESFYDLFNQRFKCIHDHIHGPRYYANIAIGAHSKPSRVEPTFQCVVVLKKSEIKDTPSPFLNRFEKYFLSYEEILQVALGYLPPCLRIVVQAGYTKAKEFIKAVEASKSLYGFSGETLDSLLLTLLPSSKQRYNPLKLDDVISAGKSHSSDVRVFLLHALLYGLKEVSGFQFCEPSDEVDLDASSLFTIIEMDEEFKEIIAEIDQEEAAASVDEALQVLHCAPAPEDGHRRIEALTDSCVIISLLQQWIVRYLCKRLMQLMTPEALAIHHHKIPTSYCENYLVHQVHFSLKQLLSRHLKWLGDDSQNYPTKLLCFTRSSSLITQKLPAQHPSKVHASGLDSSSCEVNLKEFVCDDPKQLLLCKLTSRLSQGNVEKLLKQFTSDDTLRVFLVLVNMQDVTRNMKKVVNHLRIMIENAENHLQCHKKLFVVLLHFPPMMFFDACYPSLFVRGWDHHYLDTIAHTHFERTSPVGAPIDIKHWFSRLCLADVVDEEAVVVALHSLVKEAIPVILSRVCFGSQKSSPFNRPMDGLERSRSIKTLLIEKGVGQVLCSQFHSYWKPKVMIAYIRKAADFTYHHESTLNLTDSVQTIFKSLFFDFMVHMISRMNENFNIDILFSPNSSEAVHKLFLDTLKVLQVPNLSELKTRSSSLTTPISMSSRGYYSSRFPFFRDIFQALEDLIDKCREHVNQQTDDDPVVELPHSRQTKRHKEQLLSEVGKAQFTNILKGTQVRLINVVCSAISSDECVTGQVGQLWQRYLGDFIQLKFHLVSMSGESFVEDLGVQILKDYFSPLGQEHDVLTRLVALHAHVHVHQLSLARATTILRTLNRLESALSPTLTERADLFSFAESLQVSGYIFRHRQKDFAIHIINRFFTTLQALLQDPVDSSGLQCWYRSCQDMLSMSVLKENLYGDIPQEQSTKLTILYATFLVMQSTFEWDDCYSRAQKLFLSLSSVYLPCTEQVHGGVNVPQLVEVVLLGAHVLLNHSHGMAALKQFLEGLLRHFFSEYQAHYQPVDCKWFVELANDQFTIPSTTLECLQAREIEFTKPDTLTNCLSWGMCKFFLSRILGSDEQKSGYSDAPIILYRPEARARIGQVLTADHNLEDPGPYIPLCYQYVPRLIMPEITPNMVMKQRLAHLYYELVMENLLGHDLSLITLQKIAANIERKLADTQTVLLVEEKALLFIEKQAMFQVIIQKVAENPDENLRKVITTRMMGKVNEMFEEDSLGGAHALVLALQLLRSKEINSYNKLLQLLTDEYSNVNKEITCLKHLRPLLPVVTTCETHLFPFIGQNVDNSELGILYQQMCDAVMAVHYNKDSAQKTDQFVSFAEKWCLSSTELRCGGMDGNLAFKMTLWLCIYYQLYDKRQTSKILVRLIGRMTHVFEEEYIQLLRCFLDPRKMFHKEAAPLPINPQSQLFQVTEENQIVPVQHRGHKYDPIYDLFNPRNIAKQDYSLVSLRHSLANLVAVIVGCPRRSNHLWYHMFAANELRDSYITGFMYDGKICPGRLYDCGVELTPDGDYGRSDYLQQSHDGSLNLHSRYLFLWANFGAFCMALLTQPGAQEKISGNVISSWQPTRHYCLSQLHTVWIHMSNNLKLSFEEQSFFVMRCMERLIEHGAKNPGVLQGKMDSSQVRDDYERFWDRHIFGPSRAELSEKFDEYYQQLSREQPLLKHLKLLEVHYQYFPSEKDLRHCIEQLPLAGNPSNELNLLLHFAQEQNRLRAGAVLLPDLIEFYEWLHTDVAYTLSRKRATKVTIKDMVMKVACCYDDEKAGDHLLRLYDRVKDGYNNYVKAIGGAIGVGACANIKQENKLYTIEDDYPLLYFLSDIIEEDGGNDWLFLVIADIISAHNAFLSKVSCSNIMERYHYTEAADISPTEVNEHTCIMGIHREQHGISDYLQLVRSRYQPPSLTGGKGLSFDLPALQKDIVVAYLAGKSIIMNPSTIRTVFKFKEKHHPLHKPTDLVLDLQVFTQLPLKYKMPLETFTSSHSGEPYLKHLEFEFHSADYSKMLEVVTGLRNAAEYLLKVLEEPKPGSLPLHEDTQDLTLPQFLCSYVYNKLPPQKIDVVFSEIGINSLSCSQLTCLAELKTKFLFSVLQQFKCWIEDGLYDFCTLPIVMKKHLWPEDKHTLQSIPSCTYYRGTLQGLQQLEVDLKSLTEALRHSQSYLQTTIKEISQKPIVPYLQEIHLITEDNHLCKLIPETVFMENYVDLHIALRRLLANVRGDLASSRTKPSSEEKWIEVVIDLWDTRLKHVRERATRYQRASDFLFDPTTMKFGFQQGSGTDDSDSEAESEPESDEESKQQKHTLPITEGNVAATVKKFTVTDVAQYLYYLKLDDHVKAFEANEIDGQLLLEVMENDDAMKELGVKSILQQIRIKSKLQEYILANPK